MSRKAIYLMKLLVPVALAGLALVVAPIAAGDNPNGFLRNRAPMKQSMNALLAGNFFVEFRCAETCRLKTRLVMAPHDATAAGFTGVAAGKWFEIGRIENVELKANVWTEVRIRLNATARRVLAKSEDGVRFAGQSLAESTVSRRYGWANWVRTCKWPKT